MSKIAQAIRNNNFAEYQAARYPAIQDGEVVLFRDEDFSGVDFGSFTMGFFQFERCILDGAIRVFGQPIYFANCSLRGVDFRGAHAILYAQNCDFTDIIYDEETRFAYDAQTVSEFIDCIFDVDARQFFASQGAAMLARSGDKGRENHENQTVGERSIINKRTQ